MRDGVYGCLPRPKVPQKRLEIDVRCLLLTAADGGSQG